MKKDHNTNIQQIKDELLKFRDEREWRQFHNPKDLAEAINIEAGELLEHMLWKDAKKVEELLQSDAEYRREVEHELADIINYCLCFANSMGMDVTEICGRKLKRNAEKYPVEKAKGKATKYNKL